MKITAIESFPVHVPMRIPYITALTHRDTSDSVVVVVHTDEGIDGVGQATTSAPRYSPFEQTLEGILLTIREQITPAVVGLDPFEVGVIHERMDRVSRGHLYAQAAIDVACYDIMGKAAGRSVSAMLGGPRRETIPLVAPHLGYLEVQRLAELALDYREQGFEALNFRVGKDLKEDIEILKAVRRAVGDTMTIDVDFSQSLSLHHNRPDTAISYIRRLEEFDLQAVEQPLSQHEFEGMAKIAQAIDTPLVADEGVCTPADALRVVRMGAADIVKIKMMKVGGLYPALQIAAICQTAGVPLTVGHGLAASIQGAAEAHFAFALSHLKLPGEMNGFYRVGEDVAEGLTLRDGELLLPTGPGLGVELREEVLRA
ncbi:MAG: mandelate racemase/muconate lactonizing enzyme family protein [Nitrospinota bacterium]